MSSGEHRIPSDTIPIDQAELARMVEESKPACERQTGRLCPSCGGIDRMPPCIVCRDHNGVSAGWVTDAVYLKWIGEHGAKHMVPCPECFGQGETMVTTSKGAWRPVDCGFCDGQKTVPAAIAAVHRR